MQTAEKSAPEGVRRYTFHGVSVFETVDNYQTIYTATGAREDLLRFEQYIFNSWPGGGYGTRSRWDGDRKIVVSRFNSCD